MGVVFKFAFFALILGLLAIRGFYGWKARRSGHSGSFADDEDVPEPKTRSIALFLSILLCMAGLLVLYGVSPRWSGWLGAPLAAWLRWSGAALGLIALGSQIWVHHTLQEHWSAPAQSRESSMLIADGPYRWVRHPMYSGLMVLCFGLSLISAFWPFLVLSIVSIPMFHRAASKEEAVMIGRLGNEYGEYMKRTGRFLPRTFRPAV